MSELEPPSSELQSLLSKLPAPAPRAPGASARVLARIEHTLAVAPPPTTGEGAAGAAPASALTAKLVVPLLLAGALPAGVAGYFVGRASVTPPPPEVRVEVVQPPTPAPVPEPTNAQPPLEQPSNDEPTIDEPARPTRPTAAPLQRAEDGRPLVEAARTALLKSDAKTALELLAQHARKYPTSQLAEERSALEIQALLLAGDTAKARAAALTFKAKWKNSVFSAVAEAALTDGG